MPRLGFQQISAARNCLKAEKGFCVLLFLKEHHQHIWHLTEHHTEQESLCSHEDKEGRGRWSFTRDAWPQGHLEPCLPSNCQIQNWPLASTTWSLDQGDQLLARNSEFQEPGVEAMRSPMYLPQMNRCDYTLFKLWIIIWRQSLSFPDPLSKPFEKKLLIELWDCVWHIHL